MIPGVNAVIISVDDAKLLTQLYKESLRCTCIFRDKEPIDGLFDVTEQLRNCINARKWLLVPEEDDD